MSSDMAVPRLVDRAEFEEELDRLRVREKAHTREGDAIAAARRRLPVVRGRRRRSTARAGRPDDAARRVRGAPAADRLLLHVDPGRPARRAVRGLHVLHQPGQRTGVPAFARHHIRGVLPGPQVSADSAMPQASYDESLRYRDFMGWDMPWYSAQPSLDALLVGREIGLFHLVCYLRDGDRVFETYWTKRRGVEAMDYSYALMDLTVYGRQEPWEDSPAGWPQERTNVRTDGGAPDWPPVRPVAGRAADRAVAAARGRALRRPRLTRSATERGTGASQGCPRRGRHMAGRGHWQRRRESCPVCSSSSTPLPPTSGCTGSRSCCAALRCSRTTC